jgi:hypothetical protein
MKVGDRVWFTNQANGADDIGTLIATGSNPQGDLVWFFQDETYQMHAAHSHELTLLTDPLDEHDLNLAEDTEEPSEASKQTNPKKEK